MKLPGYVGIITATVMFGIFGAGLGAAWSGVVFGNSYSRGALAGGIIIAMIALLAGTVWRRRFIPLGLLQVASEYQRTGTVSQTQLQDKYALAYKGFATFMTPISIITLLFVIIFAIIRAF